ncbi:hypothetical protein [Flavobacterium sp.]|uniref:hypothetical protein n=1 Tax=Flavobacterium sp. TaxID=239 RepID=UPI0037B6457D
MRKFIFLFSLIGILSFFNSCSAGYVSEEPVYQNYERPQRPSSDYIWIDGGWNWNSSSNSYIQVNGNWEKPREGHPYQQGHWKKDRHGSQWVRGSYR